MDKPSIGLVVTMISLWAFFLVFTLVNAYLYLLKMRKYRFIPFLLLYVGMASLSCFVIAYYVMSLDLNNVVYTQEGFWLLYEGNMKASVLVALIGFGGLIIDLLLMLRLMTQST